MLRITTIQEDERNIKVRLYGQFTGEYIAEVERSVVCAALDSARIALSSDRMRTSELRFKPQIVPHE
jgi:hypothetical protein